MSNMRFTLEFEPGEITLLERSLRIKLKKLHNNRQTLVESTIKPETEIESVKILDSEIKKINNLLHKIFMQSRLSYFEGSEQ